MHTACANWIQTTLLGSCSSPKLSASRASAATFAACAALISIPEPYPAPSRRSLGVVAPRGPSYAMQNCENATTESEKCRSTARRQQRDSEQPHQRVQSYAKGRGHSQARQCNYSWSKTWTCRCAGGPQASPRRWTRRHCRTGRCPQSCATENRNMTLVVRSPHIGWCALSEPGQRQKMGEGQGSNASRDHGAHVRRTGVAHRIPSMSSR